MSNPTPNLSSILYTAIANGLANDTVWTDLILLDNFERYDKAQGIQTPGEVSADDNDYPRATLIGPVSGEMDLIGNDQTFGTFSLNPNDRMDWIEPGKQVFRLRITSALFTSGEYTSQTMESINAIRRLGPNLQGLTLNGQPFITAVNVRWREKEDKPENDDQRRIITEIEITIGTETHGSFLTG